MSINYKKECTSFDNFIKYNNYVKKARAKNEIEICDTLSRLEIDSIPKVAFDFDNINSMFLESIGVLGKDTKKELQLIIPKIKVVRNQKIENGCAFAIGKKRKISIHITKKPYENIDFLAYSHELGHIPALINGGKGEYLEYSEVLSIFFEYLSCFSLYKEKAKEMFLRARLKVAKNEAKLYLDMDKENCDMDIHHYMYLDNMKRDSIKYIFSLEYALNLIELFNSDPNKLKKIIDDMVCGPYSFRAKEEELGFDISPCKKILMEIR